jgi:hypothetical protein
MRLLHRTIERKLDVQSGGEVVGVVVEEVLIVVVEAGEIGVLRGDVDERKVRLVLATGANGGCIGFPVGEFHSRAVGDGAGAEVVLLRDERQRRHRVGIGLNLSGREAGKLG